MGLVKKKVAPLDTAVSEELATKSANDDSPSLASVLEQYHAGNLQVRRQAAKSMREFPEAYTDILKLLELEEHAMVRDALIDSLSRVTAGNQDILHESLTICVDMLRRAGAGLRAQIVRFVSSYADEMTEFIPLLLADPNCNMRLYTLDILQSMVHPQIPEWLVSVIERDTEANVVISAIDRAVEAGCQQILVLLPDVQKRFPNVAMMPFAIKIARERLDGAK